MPIGSLLEDSLGSHSVGPMGLLDDVVVLDLGDEATALAGAYLAELGADRRAGSRTSRGDVLRRRGGHWHAVHNAGKRSVAIDTADDAAWDRVAAALPGVDVVIGPLEPNRGDGCGSSIGSLATERRPPRARRRRVPPRRPAPSRSPTSPSAPPAGSPCSTATAPIRRRRPPATSPSSRSRWPPPRPRWRSSPPAARTGRAGRIVVSAQEAVLLTTFQTSNGNLYHWHGVVPSRHEQIAGGSTVLSGDGQWTSFTIHPPNYPRFVEWAERDIGPTVLADPAWSDPVYVSTAPPGADGDRRRAGGVARRVPT